MLLKIKLTISLQVLRIFVDFMSPVFAEIGVHDKNVITAFESSYKKKYMKRHKSQVVRVVLNDPDKRAEFKKKKKKTTHQ